MGTIINLFLADFLNQGFTAVDTLITTVLKNCMFIEIFLDEALGSSAIDQLYQFMYLFAVSLAALKFLQRGFNIYILNRDGDSDVSPFEMVIGVLYGIVLMIGFPFLYTQLVDILMWVHTSILSILKITSISVPNLTAMIQSAGLFQLLVLAVFLVMGILLWLQTVKRGFELLILRIGFPIACIGLVNSDGGIFKSYLGAIVKSTITLMIQAVLLSLSFRLIIAPTLGGLLVGVAALMAAYSVPALLQNFLVAQGSAPLGGKMYQSIQLFNMLRK